MLADTSGFPYGHSELLTGGVMAVLNDAHTGPPPSEEKHHALTAVSSRLWSMGSLRSSSGLCSKSKHNDHTPAFLASRATLRCPENRSRNPASLGGQAHPSGRTNCSLGKLLRICLASKLSCLPLHSFPSRFLATMVRGFSGDSFLALSRFSSPELPPSAAALLSAPGPPAHSSAASPSSSSLFQTGLGVRSPAASDRSPSASLGFSASASLSSTPALGRPGVFRPSCLLSLVLLPASVWLFLGKMPAVKLSSSDLLNSSMSGNPDTL